MYYKELDTLLTEISILKIEQALLKVLTVFIRWPNVNRVSAQLLFTYLKYR